jgi:hypothetical protein
MGGIWDFIISNVTSRDFLINLSTGFLIFVLDVALIAILVPRIIEKRARLKWAPAKRALLVNLLQTVRRLDSTVATAESQLDNLAGRLLEVKSNGKLNDREFADAWRVGARQALQRVGGAAKEGYEGLVAQCAVYVPCFDAELTEKVSGVIREIGVLASALARLSGEKAEEGFDLGYFEIVSIHSMFDTNYLKDHESSLIRMAEGVSVAVGQSAWKEGETWVFGKRIPGSDKITTAGWITVGEDGIAQRIRRLVNKVAAHWQPKAVDGIPKEVVQALIERNKQREPERG